MLDPKAIGAGEEQYETFSRGRKRYVQYDYRATGSNGVRKAGELFSTVKPSLGDCRKARDKWLDGEE